MPPTTMQQTDLTMINQESPKREPVPAETATPPPNGGLQAWTQVLGAHFLFFNSW